MAKQLEMFEGKKPPWMVNGPRVLVRREEAQNKIGSIVVPDSVAGAERPYRGTVLAVGVVAGVVQSGDTVHYSRYGGVEIPMKDFHPEGKEETLTLLHVDEVLLIKT